MSRHAIVLSLLLGIVSLTPCHIAASTLPTPQVEYLEVITPATMYFNDDTGKMDAEITPWSLGNHKLGGNYLYLVTSYNTHLCDDTLSLFEPSSIKKISNCKLRQSADITPSNTSPSPNHKLWSRDYYGAFSGHLIPINNQQFRLYTINHGELLNNNYFSALPERCVLAPDLGYGTLACTPANHEKSYNAFVGMSSFDWNLDNLNSSNFFEDSGPIVWPANGYVENGQKATNLGILHPFSIIKDNYLYVYFRDTSKGRIEEGRGAGLKLARAMITSSGIDPLSFKTYYNGAFTDPALPVGFDKANIHNYFSQKGGRSSPLFSSSNTPNHSPDLFSFSAAKINNSPWYLGVGQDINLGVTLRLSKDLVNWGEPLLIPGTEFVYSDPVSGGTNNFIREPFMYPTLMNRSGDSSTDIDAEEFYVVGATNSTNPFNPSYQARIVNKLKLKITLPASNGDLNGDGSVNLLDFNLLISKFGNPYTIFEFNALVSNYGK